MEASSVVSSSELANCMRAHRPALEMTLPHFESSIARLTRPSAWQAIRWSDLDRAEFIAVSIHLEMHHGQD
jgi:hypothetical protein